MKEHALSKQWKLIGNVILILSIITHVLLSVAALVKMLNSFDKVVYLPYGNVYKQDNTEVAVWTFVITEIGLCLMLFGGYVARLICHTVAKITDNSETSTLAMLAVKNIISNENKPTSAKDWFGSDYESEQDDFYEDADDDYEDLDSYEAEGSHHEEEDNSYDK